MVFVRKKSHSIKLYARKSQTPTPQRQPVEGEDCILLDTLYAKNHELHIEGTEQIFVKWVQNIFPGFYLRVFIWMWMLSEAINP